MAEGSPVSTSGGAALWTTKIATSSRDEEPTCFKGPKKVFFVYLAAAYPVEYRWGVSYKSSSVKIRDFWWEGVHSSSYPVLPIAFMKWRMSSVIKNWEPNFFSWMLVGELSFPKNPEPSKKWRHFEDPDPYRFNPLHWRVQEFSGFLTSSCYVANRGTVILQGSFYKPFFCPEIGVYTPNHSIAPKNTLYEKSRNLNFILLWWYNVWSVRDVCISSR